MPLVTEPEGTPPAADPTAPPPIAPVVLPPRVKAPRPAISAAPAPPATRQAAPSAGPEPAVPTPSESANAAALAVETAKVLHVINGEHYSGAERVQDLLAGGLPEFGYQAGFALLKPGKFAEHRQSADAAIHEVPMRRRWSLGAARRLARVVRQNDYKLIHAHTPRGLLVATLASRLTHVPLVYHVHSPARRDSTRLFANLANDLVERGCVRFPKQFITVSPSLTDHMVRLGAPADRVRCVLNGTPLLDENHPATRFRRPPLPPYVVTMIALFRPRKGAEVLIDAVAALRKKKIDVHVELVGPFETQKYEAEIDGRIKRHGLTEHVSRSAFTDDIPTVLAGADALALPSLFGEGLPMVVLEAMSAGLPVIATRCEGTTEAILDRETGLLVRPKSVGQLADAIEELFVGPTDYTSMSVAARARHAERFSDVAMARQVAAVYDRLLKKD
ncbi:glycosyltransferase [Botrimarina sp.]|uniref:glycosyltransferase n=1 Tax=Botrimarina sp. TaxID=2795802 RepID=UPI0032ED50AC